jgi:hypothetical protein
MAQIDWNQLMNQQQQPQQSKRWRGANVKFFNAYNENKEKSLEAGRPIFDEIPSISIQWPGQDVTARRIEPRDVEEHPEAYRAFIAGNEPVESGTPLSEWTLITGSLMRELQHLGFKTVEQLAEASDEVKRKLGTASQYVKMAKEWLDAANSSQAEVVTLKEQLEREKARTSRLEEQMKLLMARIEASEGTDLREEKDRVGRDEDEEEVSAPQRKPRKV